MECYFPREARQMYPGAKLDFRPDADGSPVTVNCGQCIGCRLRRSREWAIRCMHEAQMHKENCFVTFTYGNDYVGTSLDYSDFQKFMKRLRKRMPSRNIRFFMSGEYGTQGGRPHFHACLFGVDFSSDRYVWRKNAHGDFLYRSKFLEDTWGLGHVEFGELTIESAQYVAQYVVKKITGEMAEGHYEDFDIRTGEIIQKVPEFGRMSLKPGIGLDWLRKYRNDILNVGFIVDNGSKVGIPRYYKEFLRLYESNRFETIDERNADFALKFEHSEESTAKRTDVREEVTRAKYKLRKRSL